MTDFTYSALAIDDSPEVIQTIRAALGGEARLLAATSGEQGLALAERAKPDVILLDVMMEGMDGFDVCRRLKASPGTANIPVIFVTGLDGHGDELEGFDVGAVDFVTKPIEPVILCARVRTHVELARARDSLAIAHKQLAEERELIDSIISSMRHVHDFCDHCVTYATHSGDQASGDVVFSAVRPDGEQYVLLGDFTGHGLPAAIGTPLVSHVFYSLTEQGREMEEVLQAINQVLVRQLPINVFMVAVAMHVSPATGAVRLWNFGAPDVLLHDGQGRWTPLHSQEVPMGIVASDAAYEYRQLQLAGSDSLFVYSDGAIETTTSSGDLFGVERLCAALESSGEDVAQVLQHVLDQADMTCELDDITLMRLVISAQAQGEAA